MKAAPARWVLDVSWEQLQGYGIGEARLHDAWVDYPPQFQRIEAELVEVTLAGHQQWGRRHHAFELRFSCSDLIWDDSQGLGGESMVDVERCVDGSVSVVGAYGAGFTATKPSSVVRCEMSATPTRRRGIVPTRRSWRATEMEAVWSSPARGDLPVVNRPGPKISDGSSDI